MRSATSRRDRGIFRIVPRIKLWFPHWQDSGKTSGPNQPGLQKGLELWHWRGRAGLASHEKLKMIQ
jgi:hypothetical protein